MKHWDKEFMLAMFVMLIVGVPVLAVVIGAGYSNYREHKRCDTCIERAAQPVNYNLCEAFCSVAK